jgi:hypothetical protein
VAEGEGGRGPLVCSVGSAARFVARSAAAYASSDADAILASMLAIRSARSWAFWEHDFLWDFQSDFRQLREQ